MRDVIMSKINGLQRLQINQLLKWTQQAELNQTSKGILANDEAKCHKTFQRVNHVLYTVADINPGVFHGAI